MLTAIRKSNNKLAIAAYTSRSDGPFVCPECGEESILKRGMIKIPHFAHKPPVTCAYGTGESEEHRQCKLAIYEQLVSVSGLECELEKKIGNVRPDIFFESKRTNRQYAIEVQLSNLPLDRIIARTEEYNRLGVYVLWLPQYSKNLLQDRYSPSIWEKWLHAVYYGRVYYWVSGTTIKAFHFDEYSLYVEQTEYGGGYFKPSKRYKDARQLAQLNILSDFQPTKRASWHGGKIIVPNCSILLDTKIKKIA